MPYICQDIDQRQLGTVVGDGQCVALVKAWCGAPQTSQWKEGIRVKGNGGLILRGTAIATFVNGRYPSQPHGNHAAIYLSQDDTGIQVIDQWKGQPTHHRTIRWNGSGPSNDGDAFSVIE